MNNLLIKKFHLFNILKNENSFQTNINNSYNRIKLLDLPDRTLERSPNGDIFCHYKHNYNVVTNTKGKFSIDDYERMSETEIKTVKESCSENIQKAAEDNIKMAQILKKFLDEKLGENRYVFVSIGTSPSCIARVFEFSGIETKYLPISGLGKYSSYERFKNNNPVKSAEYEKFLIQQHLSANDIAKSDKTYIFFDYTLSGNSLNNFREIMFNDFRLHSLNVKFRSLNEYLEMLCEKEDSTFCEEYLDKYLKYSRAFLYGGIPHLDCDHMNNIKTCLNFESETAKLYNFMIIDYMKKKGLLKYNPKNKNSL